MTLRGSQAPRRHAGRGGEPPVQDDRRPRSAALDGLRAFAVAGVVGYHAGLTWLPGGLLGVDTFFVLSGFLITGLLLDEHRRTGRVDLRAFWAGRARRLLPGLLLVLLAVAGYVRWLAPAATDRGSVRLDAIAALGYVANWRFAFSDQSYFAHFAAPSPLLHLWSLGVEEQFYLLWPLLLLAVLGGRAARRGGHRAGGHRAAAAGRGPGRVLVTAVAGAAASTVLSTCLAIAGAGDSRLYYGTDTRAAALLVGAALAAWLRGHPAAPGRVVAPARAVAPGRAVTVLGVVGAVATAWAWTHVHGEDPALYRGGFLLVALATAAVVAAVVTRPAGALARLFAVRPLPYLGRISYGLYLWHWPVFLSLTHARTGLNGVPLLVVRVAVALGFAAASYRLLEEPIRRRRVRVPRPRLAVPAVATAIVLALVGTPAGAGAAPTFTDPATAVGGVSATAPISGGATTAAKAGSGEPVRVLLAGDSVAVTLGLALIPQLPKWGVYLLDDAKAGCSLAPGVGLPEGYGRFAEPDYCKKVETRYWPDDMKVFHPAVTALLIGRWETVDRRMPDGSVTHVGEPAFDVPFTANLNRALALLGHGRTPVALLTTPCFSGPERPDGGRYDQDDPARVTRLNQLLREAAARHPGQVSVIDLNAALCPGGRYHPTLQGVRVRLTDGTHIDLHAGPVVAPAVLPALRRLAHRPATPPTPPAAKAAR